MFKEGTGNIGNAIKSLYQKIYNAGDDEVEYFYHASPIFAQYWDEYEGDLDSIIAEVDPSELAVIKDELESYVQDANLDEGIKGAVAGGIAGGALTKSVKGTMTGAQVGSEIEDFIGKFAKPKSPSPENSYKAGDEIMWRPTNAKMVHIPATVITASGDKLKIKIKSPGMIKMRGGNDTMDVSLANSDILPKGSSFNHKADDWSQDFEHRMTQGVGEKAKNPYAIGMAQAMKSAGDKPPLEKSTIKKAHEIAKRIMKQD